MSKYCVDEGEAHIDIIVNDGKVQPGCANDEEGPDKCSYSFMLTLHNAIVKTNWPFGQVTGNRTGVERVVGRPVAFKGRGCSDEKKHDVKKTLLTDFFAISLVGPPADISGVFHMHTKPVAEMEDKVYGPSARHRHFKEMAKDVLELMAAYNNKDTFNADLDTDQMSNFSDDD